VMVKNGFFGGVLFLLVKNGFQGRLPGAICDLVPVDEIKRVRPLTR